MLGSSLGTLIGYPKRFSNARKIAHARLILPPPLWDKYSGLGLIISYAGAKQVNPSSSALLAMRGPGVKGRGPLNTFVFAASRVIPALFIRSLVILRDLVYRGVIAHARLLFTPPLWDISIAASALLFAGCGFVSHS